MPDPAPPMELCLLTIDHWSTCMSKAEWSGWIQAVGSVGALLGIWWTIRKQREMAIEGERRAKAAATAAAANNARNAVASVTAELEMVGNALPAVGPGRLRLHRSRLTEALAIAHTVQFEHLPLRHQGAVIAAKAMAVGLRDCIDMVVEADSDRSRLAAMAGLTAVVQDLLTKVSATEADVSAPA
jgi:hypothetical protein